MDASLSIVDGYGVGDVFSLVSAETIVGRHASCDLVLPSASISRRHARLQRRADAYYVDDLGSRNGTSVNGSTVSGSVRLKDRDEIQLFDVRLVFRDDRPEWEPAQSVRTTRTSSDPSAGAMLLEETVAEIDIDHLGIDRNNSNAETKLRAVVELTQSLQRGFHPDQLAPRILKSLFRVFSQASLGCLYFVDAATDDLVVGAILEKDSVGDGSSTMRPISRTIARRVLSERKAILGADPTAHDIGMENASLFDDYGATSFMCAPLIGASRQRLGSLYLDTDKPASRFSKDDLDVMATVAFLVGQAIEESSLHMARYHAVVDTAADGVLTVDERGVIESVNPAIQRIFGYSPMELVGHSVRMLIPGIGERSRDDFFVGDRETVARRKDGTELPIHVSGGSFELDGQRHFTGILYDITDRKRFETELKQLNETLEQRVQQRTGHVRLLQDIAVIANEADSIETAFRAALQRICRYMNWPVGHVYLRLRENPGEFADTGIWALSEPRNYERLVEASRQSAFRSGRGTVGRVIERRKAQWNVDLKSSRDMLRKDATLECGLRAYLAFPLFMGEEVVGVVEFFAAQSVEPDERFLNVMNHIGTQLGRVVERRHLQEDLIDAVWYQQRRFGQELHDSLGQQLSGIGMMLSSIARKLQADNHRDAGRLSELSAMIQQSKEEARKLSKGLFPVEVDAEGLRSALEEFAATTRQRYDADCVFNYDRRVAVRDNNVATHLFRIAQEAVINAVNHARPSRITVSLSLESDALVLSITDDGDGLRGHAVEKLPGMGIRIMRYRANVIGATLNIQPNEHGGTTVRCTVGRST